MLLDLKDRRPVPKPPRDWNKLLQKDFSGDKKML